MIGLSNLRQLVEFASIVDQSRIGTIEATLYFLHMLGTTVASGSTTLFSEKAQVQMKDLQLSLIELGKLSSLFTCDVTPDLAPPDTIEHRQPKKNPPPTKQLRPAHVRRQHQSMTPADIPSDDILAILRSEMLRDEEDMRFLTLEEELALGERIQRGLLLRTCAIKQRKAELAEYIRNRVVNPAIETFCRHYYLMIVGESAKNMYRGVEFLDLVQEIFLGLLKTAKAYDPKRGLKFSTYFTYWMRLQVQRAVIEKGHDVRLPNYLDDAVSGFYRKWRQMEQEEGRTISLNEMAKALGKDPHEISYLLRVRSTRSIHELIGENSDAELGDFIPDVDATSPEESATEGNVRDNIQRALAGLSPRHRRVLELRFGLVGDDGPQTHEDIGRQIGLTRERARQITEEALEQVRNGPWRDVLLELTTLP
jgi:RNA polymerase primary sigma factor